jgi:L-lysine exporter family protein LysE/ArgO
MNNALKSYKAGVAIGFGAMSADILYLSLILAGIIGFINNPIFLRVVGSLGTLFLLYMAYTIYKSRDKEINLHAKSIKGKNILKIYAQGFVLTLLNPYTIIFWFSIAGYAASKDLHIFMTLLGMLLSLVLWTTLMPYVVHRSKHKLSQKSAKYLSILSALILSGFAISLLVHIVFFTESF